MGEKFIEFRPARVIATMLFRTMGQNCCRISRWTLMAEARFNRNVRIAVHISALGRHNEFGDVVVVPLRLPTRRLTCRRRTPIGEIEALAPSNQLSFDRLGCRRGTQLMAMGCPAQYEPLVAKLKRDIRTTGRAEPSREISDKCQPIRLTGGFWRVGGFGIDDARWRYPNRAENHSQDARLGIELRCFPNTPRLRIP